MNIFSPGDLAIEASKQEKFIRAYDMRKKLEINGAIAFRSAERNKKTSQG